MLDKHYEENGQPNFKNDLASDKIEWDRENINKVVFVLVMQFCCSSGHSGQILFLDSLSDRYTDRTMEYKLVYTKLLLVEKN